ncbi:Myosin-Ie [Penaeus vannamei]|uniref:Myosin-Ie n=1 Tax=Penaeus vannamei TaxID=6689 RepID=A0A3R7P0L0_PENVA|nr:Myosin-Ie [Penaeus vannamei]
MAEETQMDILSVVAAILHMGNISFVEQNNAATISDAAFPCLPLGIDEQKLGQKLTSRVFDSKWEGKSERVDVTLNLEQAQFARDAWFGSNPHYQPFNHGFTIKHYAGNVSYHVENFCEKNRDVLFTDIIEVMQGSTNTFIRSLFPDVLQKGSKTRPTTAGTKIRTQANELVTTLMKCVPHYIRCIKPNETKKPHDWDDQMVKHQVEYLGLKENIKVKRAGFAYRRPYQKFLHRYAILTKETWPAWYGEPTEGINVIMRSVNMDPAQYQIGRSKIFVKDPESLYMLEESRERKFDHYARVIQKAFKKYFSKQRYLKEKMAASDLLVNRKERRRNSLNRNFYGDYIGVEYKPGLTALIPRRDKVEFALTVDKFDRRFKKTKRDLILTKSHLYLIGRMQVKKGPEKGQIKDVIKRKIDLENISQATLSTYQDDLVLIHVRNDYESLLEIRFKTEFLMVLNNKLKERHNRELPLNFINSFDFRVKKTGWGGGGTRRVRFTDGTTDEPLFASSGSTLSVKIAHGLSSTSRAPVEVPFQGPQDRPKTPGLAAVSPRPRASRTTISPPSAQPVTSPGFPRPPVARMPLNPGGGPPAFRLPGMGSPPIQAMQPRLHHLAILVQTISQASGMEARVV